MKTTSFLLLRFRMINRVRTSSSIVTILKNNQNYPRRKTWKYTQYFGISWNRCMTSVSHWMYICISTIRSQPFFYNWKILIFDWVRPGYMNCWLGTKTTLSRFDESTVGVRDTENDQGSPLDPPNFGYDFINKKC